MSLESQIHEASSRNEELLAILAETDHAPPDLQQQTRYLSDLSKQLSDVQKKLDDLEKRRSKDLKDHVKYRDSTMRRFAYKVSGKKEKFEEKAAKEEKDYFEGLQQTQESIGIKTELEGLIKEGKEYEEKLSKEVERHKKAQVELDQLYDMIFQGPTENYPDEDKKEYDCDFALKTYHDSRVSLEGEQQALKLLIEAKRNMSIGLQSMSSALSYSTWDMFGGGSLTDMMERSELSQAERSYSRTLLLFNQAKSSSQSNSMTDLPQVQVAMGSIMSDVFFDNIFTDMAFHDKIEQSNRQMRTCAGALQMNLEKVQGNVRQMTEELKEKERKLSQSRKELQQARMAIFQQNKSRSS